MRNRGLALRAIAVGRPGGLRAGTARKDLVCWSDFRVRYGFFFRELFGPPSPEDDRFGTLGPVLVRRLAEDFAASYTHTDDPEVWLAGLRAFAARHGFAPDTRSYRLDPGRYAGPARDAVDVVRVCLTGSAHGPDLLAVAQVLGEKEVLRRLGAGG